VPVALAVVCFAAACTPSEPIRPEAIRPIKTLLVGAGEETRTQFFSGKVEASKSAELAFAAPGVLIEFSVSEGQRVAKGELDVL
jgi:multidrug efflux pump subunit AcrA (membrane-fusion protein)